MREDHPEAGVERMDFAAEGDQPGIRGARAGPDDDLAADLEVDRAVRGDIRGQGRRGENVPPRRTTRRSTGRG